MIHTLWLDKRLDKSNRTLWYSIISLFVIWKLFYQYFAVLLLFYVVENVFW